MLTIETSQQQQVAIVTANGRIDSSNAHELGAALTGAIDAGRTFLVLDLEGVDYMSSAGLREIVSALKQLRARDGDLRIANPSQRVLDILDLSGLYSVFQVFPSRAEAVSSF
jgi:anti-anti-sigma factor